jgi:hypothetical protein
MIKVLYDDLSLNFLIYKNMFENVDLLSKIIS